MIHKGSVIRLIRLLFVVVCCAVLTACTLPSSRLRLEQAVVQTAVADSLVGTHVAGTLTAIIPTPTSTPLPPTIIPDTPTPSLTPQPTMTPTMQGVWLTLQQDTSCLTGPGIYYESLVLVRGGQMVEIMALDPYEYYYYIRDPNNFSQYCWIPVGNAPVTGNLARLPVITVEPIPIPADMLASTPAMKDFIVRYDTYINCNENYGIVLYVENTGRLIWRSIRVQLTDNQMNRRYVHQSDLFRGVTSDPCVLDMDNAQDDLLVSEGSPIACVNSGQFKYNPSGHKFTVRVTLYSMDGRKGESLTKTITFIP